MKNIAFALVVTGMAVICVLGISQSVSAADASAQTSVPADRVVVMYFHRTQRCPTCLKMGSYSEEAVKTGFAQQIKDGTIEFHYIDFQDKKNEAMTKAYKVSGPTLIVARVADSKVAEIKNLKDMWTKVSDKGQFLAYVQSNVKESLKSK
jgi:Zn-dependent alcohol dehydrogenase